MIRNRDKNAFVIDATQLQVDRCTYVREVTPRQSIRQANKDDIETMPRSHQPPKNLFAEQQARLNSQELLLLPTHGRSVLGNRAEKTTLDFTIQQFIDRTFEFHRCPSTQKKLAESCTAVHDDGGSLRLRRHMPASILSIQTP